MQREFRGKDFDYLLYEPKNYSPNGKYPLILFLHGSGERGDDVNLVKRYGVPKYCESKPLSAFVLAPQCKKNRTWLSLTEELYALVREITETYPIDADAVSVTGLSMGGFGVFQMIMDYPYLFSAAAPLCGGGTAWRLNEVAHLPIRIYHGEKDGDVDCFYSKDAYNRLKKYGAADVSLFLYPDFGHNIWDYVYNETDLLEWLISKRRK